MGPAVCAAPAPAPTARATLALWLTGALLVLLQFGPSNLRFGQREVDAALRGEFDIFAAFDVACWLLGGGLALLSVSPSTQPRLLAAHGPMLWALIYGGLALLSAIWSVQPAYTVFFALKIPIFLICCTAFMERARDEGRDPSLALLRIFFAYHALSFALIILLYLVARDMVEIDGGSEGLRVTGGWLGDYGRAATGMAFFCVWSMVRRTRSVAETVGLACLLALALCFLWLSRTRTSMAGCGMGMLLIALAARGALLRWSWVLLAPAAALVLAGSWQEVFDLINRGQSAQTVSGLSGRAHVFSFLIDAWRDSPVIGYGHAAGQRVWMMHYTETTGIVLGFAHDAVSSLLIDLGLAGLVVGGFAFLYTTAWIGRRYVGALLDAGQEQPRRADLALMAALIAQLCLQGIGSGSFTIGVTPWLIVVPLILEWTSPSPCRTKP